MEGSEEHTSGVHDGELPQIEVQDEEWLLLNHASTNQKIRKDGPERSPRNLNSESTKQRHGNKFETSPLRCDLHRSEVNIKASFLDA